jgi:dTDP-4-dehydrorhamnose reductase
VKTALIGSTGFVGQNLQRQVSFDALYHSTDIAGIDDRSFGRVVCAGVTAVKWWANQNPEEDRRRIDLLISHLDRVHAAEFVLISTVDVYRDPVEVDENTPVPVPGLHAYGANRLFLERWAAERFSRCHVLRLPALFGSGLKKNALFDLINDNRLEFVEPACRFQWYPLARLARDIDTVVAAGLDLVNLVTEPVTTADIQARCFPDKRLGGAGQRVDYDIQTAYAGVFGQTGRYVMTRGRVLAAITDFVSEASAR